MARSKMSMRGNRSETITLGRPVRRFKTFKRSANSFDELVTARKFGGDRGLTEAEARRACKTFNDSRTPSQIRRGTKMEYTEERD